MRWFKHDCLSRSDPRLMEVVQRHGGEGLALYWTVLEEMGRLSNTLHLKVTGLSEGADRSFRGLQDGTGQDRCFGEHVECIEEIPEFGARLLAASVKAKVETLEKVLATCVEFKIFDRAKWDEYNVLYSPDFASLADPYTRSPSKRARHNGSGKSKRAEDVEKNSSNVPTTVDTLERTVQSQHTTDQTLETTEQNLFPRTEAETETEEEKKKNRTEADGSELLKLSTHHPQPPETLGHRSLGIEIERIAEYGANCRIIVQSWNSSRGESFQWEISDLDLKRLILDGDIHLKQQICYQSLHITGGRPDYPLLLYRAVRLMLAASEKSRITNQFGWLWACLNGTDGSPPWVQQITPQEKRSNFGPIQGSLVGCAGLISGGEN